ELQNCLNCLPPLPILSHRVVRWLDAIHSPTDFRLRTMMRDVDIHGQQNSCPGTRPSGELCGLLICSSARLGITVAQ
ncbi:MAG: hypothetical protein WBW14_25750, partial [Candidatus Acidiferrum sp.]